MKETLRKQDTATMKKLIAIALVLVSLIFLLSSGFKIRVNVAGNKYTVDDIFRYAGTSTKEFQQRAREGLVDISEDLADYGLHINSNKVANLMGRLLDGKITLLDLAKSSSYVNKVLGRAMKFQNSYDAYDDMYYYGYAGMYNSMQQVKDELALLSTVMWILVVVVVATALYTIFAILTDKKRPCLIYTIVAAVLLIALAIVAKALNNELRMFERDVASLLEDIDVLRYSSELDFRIFRVRAVAVFGLMAIVGAGVLCSGSAQPAAKSVRAVNPRPVVAPAVEKTCHGCGKNVREDQLFCDICGTDLRKKPEPPQETRCAVCGSVVDPNAVFCGHCGNAMRK